MILAALAVAAPAALARAEPAPGAVALTWEAPAGCPSADRILAETDRILAGSTVRTDPTIEVHARVEQQGEHWHLALETRRGDSVGARSLDGESCTAIAEAMIVILVLMIDPALVPTSPPKLEPPPAPPPPPPPPVVARAAPAPVAAPPRPGCRWGAPSIGLAALGDLGALPAPAGGGEASFALRRCSLGAELAARGLYPRTGEAELDAGAGGDLWLLAGGAAGTLETGPGRFGAAARAGLEAGVMSGRGVGIHNPDAGRAPWLAATAGGAGLLRLSERLQLRLALDLVVPLLRPRFVIDDLGAVHRAGPVAARLALGVELRFR